MSKILDRYAASYGDFVPVAADPHSGPRRAKRAKEILRNQPRALPGYQGQISWLVGLTVLMAALAAAPIEARAADYHHVHLAAPNAAEGVQWYIRHMGCGPMPRKDACLIGTTQIIFANRESKGGSLGTGIDHIGFSFRDLTAKMKELESAGVKVVTPMRDAPGIFKLAFVEDPWGTRIEVVEDPEYLGFHHIHLRSVDPERTLKWYKDVFGGETASLKGRFNGLLYGKVWLLVARQTEGQLTPSEGRSIDHLGFAFADLDAAATQITKKGISFQQEPRPFTNALGQNMKISFLVGPDGVRIEVVQPKA